MSVAMPRVSSAFPDWRIGVFRVSGVQVLRKAEGCANAFPASRCGKREVESELRESKVEGRGSRVEYRELRVAREGYNYRFQITKLWGHHR
jgi:hypothetical protein